MFCDQYVRPEILDHDLWPLVHAYESFIYEASRSSVSHVGATDMFLHNASYIFTCIVSYYNSGKSAPKLLRRTIKKFNKNADDLRAGAPITFNHEKLVEQVDLCRRFDNVFSKKEVPDHRHYMPKIFIPAHM